MKDSTDVHSRMQKGKMNVQTSEQFVYSWAEQSNCCVTQTSLIQLKVNRFAAQLNEIFIFIIQISAEVDVF